MEQKTNQILFALLRSAICGTELTEAERACFSKEDIPTLLSVAKTQDIAHLLVFSLKQNGLLSRENEKAEKELFGAIYRCEILECEYRELCTVLEAAEIAFVSLKGSVIRAYYPEPWMRTSCDIDILVKREDLENAVSYLKEKLQYTETERGVHDVSLFSPMGIHVELHFDLVEEGRANNAIDVLKCVWDHVFLRKDSHYCYEMTDAFFYFYHIAHMAKHFENGGCGIRPFIDLWLLDHMIGADIEARDQLLSDGGLLVFADISRKLSRVWFGGEAPDALLLQMESFIVDGGIYGSADNRVALLQKKKGGRFGYILSRIFIPYAKLKRYYPILDKHPWLMPFMQVRRWFMILNPNIAKMAKREIVVNQHIDKSKADEMGVFLEKIGL